LRVIPAEKNRIFGLDILRASAIVLVLLAHTWPAKTHQQWPLAFAVLGVELFFVLSGFLIGGILIRLAEEDRLRSFRGVWGFWRRRWFRTLPNYYLFLTLQLLWRTWIQGFPDQISTNWEYLFFVQNLRHPPGLFFRETWSLAVEEWFYLLFPLLLFAALQVFKRPGQVWIAVIALFLAVPTALRLWIAGSMDSHIDPAHLEAHRRTWDEIVRMTVMLRLDVVMYGVIAALLAARCSALWRRMARWWPIGLGLVSIAVASIGWHVPLETAKPWHGFALWPILAIGIAFLLARFSQIPAAGGVAARCTSWIAKVSYALYLCHGLVLLAMWRWMGPKTVVGLERDTFLWCLTAWLLSLSVAGIAYRWFEKPMMDLRDRFEEARTGKLQERVEAPPIAAEGERRP
jgi:peptidoglycan/LPS O-acetylase OafA/YrhL